MRPKNLLIYYGWLNSFNYPVNGWNNEKVAQELAQYDVLVLGSGIQQITHGDWANTSIIVPRIKALNPSCEIYGYVTTNQADANWLVEVNQWLNNLAVDGIFMDESGYDYGTVATNGRKTFNWKVDFIHSHGLKAFVNAWNIDHVVTTIDDPSYPNSTYNPNMLESNLNPEDLFLLESFGYGPYGGGGALQYETATQWKMRGDKAHSLKDRIRLAGCVQIADGDPTGQFKFDFLNTSAVMFDLNVFGSSDILYGSGSSQSKMWMRFPDYEKLKENEFKIEPSGNVYLRYYTNGKLELDWTLGAETFLIKIY